MFSKNPIRSWSKRSKSKSPHRPYLEESPLGGLPRGITRAGREYTPYTDSLTVDPRAARVQRRAQVRELESVRARVSDLEMSDVDKDGVLSTEQNPLPSDSGGGTEGVKAIDPDATSASVKVGAPAQMLSFPCDQVCHPTLCGASAGHTNLLCNSVHQVVGKSWQKKSTGIQSMPRGSVGILLLTGIQTPPI